MTNNINVKLDTSVTPNALDVEDNGGHDVWKKPHPQVITWKLTGPLAQGHFVPMSDQHPGFEWINYPPPACFGPATIDPNGHLSITDNHIGAASYGVWVYRLRACYGGKTYETIASIDHGTTAVNAMTIRDPIIINR